jgi:hypothetical protein
VPSLPHELIVGLFRDRGELLRELVGRRLGLGGLVGEDVSGELTQVTPTEYRADGVTVFRDAQRRARLAVVLEVQRAIDRDKRRTWPVYVATTRARFDCPTILLVVALNAEVARWARASIALGHPGFTLTPVVISGAEIPQIVDEKEARRAPQLAVLSALAHPKLQVAAAAITGIEELPEEEARLYFDAVLAGLPHQERQNLEAQMQGYQYRSQFARTFVAQGRQEGKQLAVRELAQVKLGVLTAEQEAAISSIEEEEKLSALIVGLGQARTRQEAKRVMGLVSSGRPRTPARRRASGTARALTG